MANLVSPQEGGWRNMSRVTPTRGGSVEDIVTVTVERARALRAALGGVPPPTVAAQPGERHFMKSTISSSKKTPTDTRDGAGKPSPKRNKPSRVGGIVKDVDTMIRQILVGNHDTTSVVLATLCDAVTTEMSRDICAGVVEIYISQKRSQALHKLIRKELQRNLEATSNEGLILRGDSVATQLAQHYALKVGRKYLYDLLRDTVLTICACSEAYEVDPSVATSRGLDCHKNAIVVRNTSNKFLQHVYDSMSSCPVEIRRLCQTVKNVTEERFPGSGSAAVATFFFFRLLLPIAVAPPTEIVHPRQLTVMARRALVIFAKTVQQIVHGVEFSRATMAGEFAHMEVISEYVRQQAPVVNQFAVRLAAFYSESAATNYLGVLPDPKVVQAEKEHVDRMVAAVRAGCSLENGNVWKKLKTALGPLIGVGVSGGPVAVTSSLREIVSDNIQMAMNSRGRSRSPKQQKFVPASSRGNSRGRSSSRGRSNRPSPSPHRFEDHQHSHDHPKQKEAARDYHTANITSMSHAPVVRHTSRPEIEKADIYDTTAEAQELRRLVKPTKSSVASANSNSSIGRRKPASKASGPDPLDRCLSPTPHLFPGARKMKISDMRAGRPAKIDGYHKAPESRPKSRPQTARAASAPKHSPVPRPQTARSEPLKQPSVDLDAEANDAAEFLVNNAREKAQLLKDSNDRMVAQSLACENAISDIVQKNSIRKTTSSGAVTKSMSSGGIGLGAVPGGGKAAIRSSSLERAPQRRVEYDLHGRRVLTGVTNARKTIGKRPATDRGRTPARGRTSGPSSSTERPVLEGGSVFDDMLQDALEQKEQLISDLENRDALRKEIENVLKTNKGINEELKDYYNQRVVKPKGESKSKTAPARKMPHQGAGQRPAVTKSTQEEVGRQRMAMIKELIAAAVRSCPAHRRQDMIEKLNQVVRQNASSEPAGAVAGAPSHVVQALVDTMLNDPDIRTAGLVHEVIKKSDEAKTAAALMLEDPDKRYMDQVAPKRHWAAYNKPTPYTEKSARVTNPGPGMYTLSRPEEKSGKKAKDTAPVDEVHQDPSLVGREADEYVAACLEVANELPDEERKAFEKERKAMLSNAATSFGEETKPKAISPSSQKVEEALLEAARLIEESKRNDTKHSPKAKVGSSHVRALDKALAAMEMAERGLGKAAVAAKTGKAPLKTAEPVKKMPANTMRRQESPVKDPVSPASQRVEEALREANRVMDAARRQESKRRQLDENTSRPRNASDERDEASGAAAAFSQDVGRGLRHAAETVAASAEKRKKGKAATVPSSVPTPPSKPKDGSRPTYFATVDRKRPSSLPDAKMDAFSLTEEEEKHLLDSEKDHKRMMDTLLPSGNLAERPDTNEKKRDPRDGVSLHNYDSRGRTSHRMGATQTNEARGRSLGRVSAEALREVSIERSIKDVQRLKELERLEKLAEEKKVQVLWSPQHSGPPAIAPMEHESPRGVQGEKRKMNTISRKVDAVSKAFGKYIDEDDDMEDGLGRLDQFDGGAVKQPVMKVHQDAAITISEADVLTPNSSAIQKQLHAAQRRLDQANAALAQVRAEKSQAKPDKERISKDDDKGLMKASGANSVVSGGYAAPSGSGVDAKPCKSGTIALDGRVMIHDSGFYESVKTMHTPSELQAIPSGVGAREVTPPPRQASPAVEEQASKTLPLLTRSDLTAISRKPDPASPDALDAELTLSDLTDSKGSNRVLDGGKKQSDMDLSKSGGSKFSGLSADPWESGLSSNVNATFGVEMSRVAETSGDAPTMTPPSTTAKKLQDGLRNLLDNLEDWEDALDSPAPPPDLAGNATRVQVEGHQKPSNPSTQENIEDFVIEDGQLEVAAMLEKAGALRINPIDDTDDVLEDFEDSREHFDDVSAPGNSVSIVDKLAPMEDSEVDGRDPSRGAVPSVDVPSLSIGSVQKRTQAALEKAMEDDEDVFGEDTLDLDSEALGEPVKAIKPSVTHKKPTMGFIGLEDLDSAVAATIGKGTSALLNPSSSGSQLQMKPLTETYDAPEDDDWDASD